MDEDTIFRILFLAVYAVFFAIRMRFRVPSARRTPERREEFMTKATVFLVFAILSYLSTVILYLLALPWIEWSYVALPSLLRWIGIFFAGLSVILVGWIHVNLGRQYSAELAIQEEHALITTGPYSRTRHPMYTVLNMFSISLSITTASLLVMLFAVLVAIPFPWIARMEEEMLLKEFGSEYQEYMDRTGRFFPRLR
ncbi:MAG: isoprenylcysteine carboxylmethyltransferase family protein [Candidatus Thorarchaeota archaeon]|nr:MAG: isoprenylcysteine carboxylmethyltransferase family protein [Candidatus Thorarchaeota archaeon]